MPLSHISLRAGKPEACRQAIFDSLYRAMRETLDVAEDDQFMTITEHDAADFRYGAAFGIARSDALVLIQVTVFNTRTVEQKKALSRRCRAQPGQCRAPQQSPPLADPGPWAVAETAAGEAGPVPSRRGRGRREVGSRHRHGSVAR